MQCLCVSVDDHAQLQSTEQVSIAVHLLITVECSPAAAKTGCPSPDQATSTPHSH
eukprot:m.95447 g.95447  ORF g.95447 m.95447 type:complete len:55 (-) comp13896_c1_seq1:155-319(-)